MSKIIVIFVHIILKIKDMAKQIEKQGLSEITELVGQTLNEAAPYGLEIEVMASAMQKLQKTPGMDISVALQNALTDWDI